MCVCVFRKEAREYLEKQREVSNARVRDHNNDSGCASTKTTPTGNDIGRRSTKTTPTGNDSSTKTTLDNDSGRGSTKTTPTDDGKQTSKHSETNTSNKTLKRLRLDRDEIYDQLSTGSILHSLPHSPRLTLHLLEKCKNVKVKVTKCTLPTREIDGSGSSESDNTSLFYSSSTVEPSQTTVNTNQTPTTSRLPSPTVRGTTSDNTMSGKNKKKKKKKMDDSDVVPTKQSRHHTSHNTSSTAALMKSELFGDHTSHNTSSTAALMKSELFGDSDSDDCIIISTSCSSNEEEIMNISFEDALKVEPARPKFRRRKYSVFRSSDKKVRERGKDGGKKKEMKSEVKSRKGTQRQRERRTSVSKSQTERCRPSFSDRQTDNNPLHVRPESLINLTAVSKGKQHITSSSSSSSSSSVIHKLDGPSLSLHNKEKSQNQEKPSAVIRPPSYTIFRKTEITLTGII